MMGDFTAWHKDELINATGLSSGEPTFSRELRNISLRGCGAASWQSPELILKVVSRHCIATSDGRHADEGKGTNKHRLHSFLGGNF